MKYNIWLQYLMSIMWLFQKKKNKPSSYRKKLKKQFSDRYNVLGNFMKLLKLFQMLIENQVVPCAHFVTYLLQT